nr:hypothetical protein [Tanacetum cinerariifolium]
MVIALHIDEELYPRFLTTIAGQMWILDRGLKLVVMKCLQSLEYLATLGGAIGCAIDKGMQDGLVVDIDHEKSGRRLVDFVTYNPSAEANYAFAVNALRVIDFPLLAQLESQKDAGMANIMGLIHLEGLAVETLKASHLSKTISDVIFLWKEERVRLLVGYPGASTTLIYSPGSSSTLIYSPGSLTPPHYSPGASTPQSYSMGTSRNAECSNCKHLLDKITVLEATVDMDMHPEQHTVNSAALYWKT